MDIFNRIRNLGKDPYEAFLRTVSKGKDVVDDFDVRDALHYISKMQAQDISRPLTEQEAKRTFNSNVGDTLLILCAELFSTLYIYETLPLMRAFLERGADPYTLNKNGESAFSIMTHYVNDDVIDIFKPYIDVTKPVNANGDNIIMASLEYGYWEDLFDVLTPEQIKAGVLHCGNDGYSALTVAAGNTDMYLVDIDILIEKLAEIGIDLNTPDKNGNTMASMAVEYRRDILYSLHKNGADLNAPLYNGQTLLMKTIAEEKGFDIVEKVLKYSDVNAPSKTQYPTALCSAANCSDTRTIAALFNAGAKLLPDEAKIVVSGLLKNNRLLNTKCISFLKQVQEQLEPDIFKPLLDKALREFYEVDKDDSLVRVATARCDEDMTLFLIDNGFTPFDKFGASSNMCYGNKPLKQLLISYEDLYEKTNGANVMPEVYLGVDKLKLIVLFAQLFENAKKENQDGLAVCQGAYAAKRLQYQSRTKES